MVSFVPSEVRGFTRGGLKITEGKGVALTVTYSKVIKPSDKTGVAFTVTYRKVYQSK